MFTVFVVHHGADDPSLAAGSTGFPNRFITSRAAWPTRVAGGLPNRSIACPRSWRWRSRRRSSAVWPRALFHPDAGWSPFSGLSRLKGLNSEAYDAATLRAGICVSAAALLFLVRWLDSGRWMPAAGFVVFGALVWRVHLVFGRCIWSSRCMP